MESLQDRCKRTWESMGLSSYDIQWGISMLTHEAISNPNMILDKQIENAATFLRLFSGLPQAIVQYSDWERKQI